MTGKRGEKSFATCDDWKFLEFLVKACKFVVPGGLLGILELVM